MLQKEVFPYYRKYVSELNDAYDIMKQGYADTFVEDLCALRGYFTDEQKSLIRSMNLGSYTTDDVEQFKVFSEELGLLSKNGYFLLNGRYNVPIYSISGDLVSLVGYYPDKKKYITLATPFFSKECMFFNFKQAYDLSWSEYGGYVILVEGIFDCLSLRALGLPCIATMGSSVSKIKGELLKLFKKVLAIPDDDVTGRKALNRYSKFGWKVPDNTTMLKFSGGLFHVGNEVLHCKDMDNFASWYDADDVREVLLSFRDSKEEIEEFKL